MNFEYCDSGIYSVDNSNYLFDCYSFEIIKFSNEYLQMAKELVSDPKNFSLQKASPAFIAPVIMAIQKGHFFRKIQIGNVSAKLTQMTPIFSFTPTHKCLQKWKKYIQYCCRKYQKNKRYGKYFFKHKGYLGC